MRSHRQSVSFHVIMTIDLGSYFHADTTTERKFKYSRCYDNADKVSIMTTELGSYSYAIATTEAVSQFSCS